MKKLLCMILAAVMVLSMAACSEEKAEKTTTDSKARRELHRRQIALDPLLREMNELTALTRRYYERSYCKNEKYTL